MGKFQAVGGLWERADKHGQTVFSGKLDRWLPQGAKLWISPNGRRTNDKQPSHTLSVIEDETGPSLAPVVPGNPPPEPPADYDRRWPDEPQRPALVPAVGRVVTPGPRPSQARMPMGAPAKVNRGAKQFAGAGTDLEDEIPF